MPDYPFRVDQPPEEIVLYGYNGDCHYCIIAGSPGVVKIQRDLHTYRLQLNACRCLGCGQAYFVKLPSGVSLEAYDQEQAFQKDA